MKENTPNTAWSGRTAKQPKVPCEYCGCLIDVHQDDVCPQCGAAFDKNEHLSEYNEMQERLNRIRLETMQAKLEGMRLDNTKKKQALRSNSQTGKLAKFPKRLFLSVFILIVVIALTIVIGTFIRLDNSMDNMMPEPTVAETEPTIVETPVEVGFREAAELTNISVICDKIEEYYYPWIKPAEGFYYVRLHLVVTSKTNETVYVPQRGSIVCTYKQDGYDISAKINTISSDHLDTQIYRNRVPEYTSTDGWVYFEVPMGADLTLKYNEYITIHIPFENLQTDSAQ